MSIDGVFLREDGGQLPYSDLILACTIAALKEGIAITTKKDQSMDGEIPDPQKRHGFLKGRTVKWVGRHRIMQFVGEDEDGNIIERVGYAVFTPDGRLITGFRGFFSSEQDAIGLARRLDNECGLTVPNGRGGR